MRVEFAWGTVRGPSRVPDAAVVVQHLVHIRVHRKSGIFKRLHFARHFAKLRFSGAISFIRRSVKSETYGILNLILDQLKFIFKLTGRVVASVFHSFESIDQRLENFSSRLRRVEI